MTSITAATPELKPWQRRTLLIGRLLLTLIFAILLARLVWLVIAPAPLILPEPDNAGGNRHSGVQVSAAPYHVFGEVGEAPVIVQKKVNDAPETKLRLVLLGATHATDPKESGAIIARPGSAGEFYRVGDIVQGRTKLADVYKDRVILDTSGKLETLKFEDDDKSTAPMARQVGRSPAPSSRNDDDRIQSMTEQFSQIRRPSDFVTMAGQLAQESPELLIRSLGIESVGVGEGYSITGNSVLLKAGMQPGDKILSINSQPLGDTQSDQMLFEQVMNDGRARIEVQRGNKRFTINQNFGVQN